MKTALVSNVEYNALLELGGDPLIAVFAMLRYNKKGIVIKQQGKEGPYALIRSATGLSRTSVEKYVPTLIDLGLVHIQKNGNVAVRSRKWTRRNLPTFNSYKELPIEICKSFPDTQISVFWVRIHSNLRKQESQIGRKAERLELMTHPAQAIKSMHDRNIYRKMVKDGVTVESLQADYRSNSSMSNLGFSKYYQTIDKNNENPQSYSKSLGNYLKNKLIERGKIRQIRQIELVYPGVFDKKFANQLNDDGGTFSGVPAFFFVGKEGIYKESTPIITIR